MKNNKDLFFSHFSLICTAVILAVLAGLSPYCLAQNALPGDPFNLNAAGSNGSGQEIGGLPTLGDAVGGLPGFGTPQTTDVQVSARIAAMNNERGKATLTLQAILPKGFHAYSITQKSGGPIPTKIAINPGESYRVGPFTAQTPAHVTPADDPNNFYEMPIEEHSGTVVWTAPVEFFGSANETNAAITGSLTYQLCNSETCLEPKTVAFTVQPVSGSAALPGDNQSNPNNPAAPSADPALAANPELSAPAAVLPVPTTVPDPVQAANAANNSSAAASSGQNAADSTGESGSADSSSTVRKGLIIYAFMAFLGGLILNVMPCVLPVISLKLMAFIDQAGESRTRVFLLNLWYVAGLMSVFILLAFLSTYGLSVFTGAFSSEQAMGWGEMFSYMPVQIGMCALIFLMALSLLGVWEIPIPGFVGSGAINDVQQKEGAVGAFTKGIFTTILAVPCVGPFLAPVLGAVIGQPISFTLLIFCMIGLGMGTPYILVGLFPELLAFLPKPGRWMVAVREFMGFLLLATVVYFFQMIPSDYAVPTLSLLFSLWFMCWIINQIPYGAPLSQRFWGWSVGLLCAVGISWGMFAWYAHETVFPWDTEFSAARIEQAQKDGRVVLIDFTANWCPNCKANLYTAIQTKAVEKVVRQNNVYAVLADYTAYSPEIKKALLSFNRQAIPLLVVLPADGRGPILLDGLITRQMVVDALNEAISEAKSAEKPERASAIREQLKADYAEAVAPGM